MRTNAWTVALLAAAMMTGCSGYSAAQEMTPEELAGKSDEWVCDRLETFAYKGRVPPAWQDAAMARGLDYCIAEGVKERRQDDQLDKKRPVSCDAATGSVKPPECW